MTRAVLALAALVFVSGSSLMAQTKRAITLDDHSRLVAVGDPQRSPDGAWVAYTVTTIDAEKDKRNTDVWMVKWDGTEQIRLTSSPDSESSPRWSPDGKYLAFLASRGTEEEKKKGAQIWLLNRSGGEALKVSEVPGGLADIQWSPDSTRIAFVDRPTPIRTTNPRRRTAGSGRPRRRSSSIAITSSRIATAISSGSTSTSPCSTSRRARTRC